MMRFRHSYRSWSTTLIGFALGMFIGAVILSLACVVLEPLLPVLLGVTGIAVIVLLWFRWLLFRFRGW
jgi:hypothetical protein